MYDTGLEKTLLLQTMARTNIKRTKNLLKKQSSEEDTSNLPYDIIRNILSRLPVKSLCRFKSVSKQWNSIISGTEFAKIHLHQSMNSHSLTLCLMSPWSTSSSLSLFKFAIQSLRFEELIEFPLKKYRQAYVLCACNGLILLKNSRQDDKMYVLWNPSIRTYKKFSCPFPVDIVVTTHGICYDESNDDYKIILAATGFYAVYSYKNNLWTKESSSMHIRQDSGIFINGTLHFVGIEICEPYNVQAKEALRLELLSKACHDCLDSHYVNYPSYESCYGFTDEIYYFDPTSDKFKKFPKPECLETHSIFRLTTLGGHLCLYRNTYDMTMLEIWMMKTYGDYKSWVNFLTIENVPYPYHMCYHVKPLCLTNKGEVVLDIGYSRVVYYNTKEKNFDGTQWNYGIRSSNRNMNILHTPLICMDTLSLPTRVNKTKRKLCGHLKAGKGMRT